MLVPTYTLTSTSQRGSYDYSCPEPHIVVWEPAGLMPLHDGQSPLSVWLDLKSPRTCTLLVVSVRTFPKRIDLGRKTTIYVNDITPNEKGGRREKPKGPPTFRFCFLFCQGMKKWGVPTLHFQYCGVNRHHAKAFQPRQIVPLKLWADRNSFQLLCQASVQGWEK